MTYLAGALDDLLLVMTGRSDDVDRAQRLPVAQTAQARARAEADDRDAAVARIEAEPSR